MKSKFWIISYPFLIVFAILVTYILWYIPENEEHALQNIQTRTIQNDGYCVLFDKDYLNTKNKLCKKLEHDALRQLPEGYMFMDYVYIIKQTALSTFHRDVTSSQHLFHTKHPVYTMILYKYEGELLSVCPYSDKTYPFVISNITNIHGPAGTVFLFNSEVLHAGMKNNCQDREVIQYKICHKDDLHLLQHLQNIHQTKNDVCKQGWYEEFVRKGSYYLQLPINYLFYPFMIKREKNNWTGYIQSFIPITFYNNL